VPKYRNKTIFKNLLFEKIVMDLSTYVLVIIIVASIYAVIVREIQNRMVDRKEAERIQKESKRLSEAYGEAVKRGDKKEAEKIMQQQMELLPQMNKMMLGQLKPMAVIMIIFFAVTWVVGVFNPAINDDVSFYLYDDGKGCDKAAGDGVYSACYELNNGSEGKWTATIVAYENGMEFARNSTIFYYGKKIDDNYAEAPRGTLAVATDKNLYAKGEKIVLTAVPEKKATEVKATLDSGTYFKAELPFTIPLVFFDLKNFYQPTSWFIFISILFSLVFSLITGRFKK